MHALATAAVEAHRERVNNFITKIFKTENTNILFKRKYDNIVVFLKTGDVPLDKEAKSKVRLYVKYKHFTLVNFSS